MERMHQIKVGNALFTIKNHTAKQARETPLQKIGRLIKTTPYRCDSPPK